MKYADFEKKMRDLMTGPMSKIGFSFVVGPYLSRKRSEWLDVVFFDLDRASKDAFTVCVGVHLPQVERQLPKENGDNDVPAPYVSAFLGRLKDGGRGSQTWYRFGRSLSLSEAVDQAMVDLEQQGIPWLAQFSSLEDIAAEYKRRRVIDERTGQPKDDPVGWAVYGLILIESGAIDVGKRWLSQARDQLAEPLYVIDGRRFVSEPVAGAKPMARPPYQRALKARLDELLTGR